MTAHFALRFKLSLAILAGFVIFGDLRQGMAANRSASIQWSDNLEQALRDAATYGRPVLAHFYSNNCVPCKMLDAKAFKDPTLCHAMHEAVIPVKINVDHHRDLAERYQVTRWPTDLYLFPNGQELYRGVSPQDPSVYVKLLDRVAIRNRDWITERIAAQSTIPSPSEKNPSAPRVSNSIPTHAISTQSDRFQTVSKVDGNVSDSPVEATSNPYCVDPTPETQFQATESTSPFHLASRSVAAKENRYQSRNMPVDRFAAPSDAKVPNDASATASVTMSGVFHDSPTIDLDGNCPVTLMARREWVLGNPTCAVQHRGRIYYCINEEAQQAFLAAPDRYAPVLSGYDIVHFLQTGQLVAGKREFGCFFGLDGEDERVFLFASPASRGVFDLEAKKYAYSLGRTDGQSPTQAEPRVATGSGNSAVAR